MTCAHLVPDEAQNCANKCLSELCYNEVDIPSVKIKNGTDKFIVPADFW